MRATRVQRRAEGEGMMMRWKAGPMKHPGGDADRDYQMTGIEPKERAVR